MHQQNQEDLNKQRLDPQLSQAPVSSVAQSLSQEEAQQQLLELEAIYATAPIGLSFVDTQLRFVRLNQRLAEIHGLSIEETLGRTVREVVPELADALEPLYRQLIESGTPLVNQEIQGKTHAQPGIQRDWLASFYPLKGADRRVVGVNTMVQEITDRKRAERQLQQREAELHLMTEALPQQLWTATPEGQIDYINWRWVEYTGVTLNQLQNKCWTNLVHPDDQPQVLAAWERAVQTIGIYQVEMRLKGADGQYRWFLGQALPLRDEQGNIIKWYGTNTDISGQKQAEAALKVSEERFQGFINANIIGILRGDVYGGIHYANDEFLRIVGYTREDLETGRLLWTDLTPAEYSSLDEAGVAEARERGACTPYEKEYIRKDGSRIPVLVGFNLLGDRREEAFAFILDLSDRKQLERTLRQQAEALVQANQIKDEFLAVLSHELRTPLNPILGWVKLLQTRQLSPERTQEALATIERNAKLQTQLVEDLLDISRILRGKLTLNWLTIDLIQPIMAAIETIRLTAEAKFISIHTHLDPTVGPIVGDPDRLQQVVWNLLSNAVKFTPEGGRVDVSLSCVTSHLSLVAGRSPAVEITEPRTKSIQHATCNMQHAPSYARITVTDTGKGISPDFLPHVFESFRQQDGSTTRRFGGLGLGLAIVRQLVEAHGGSVSVDSPGEGLGATFTVELPLPTAPITSPTPADRPSAAANLNGVRVLVVEDDQDSLDLMTFSLQQQGAIVTSLSASQPALHAVSQTPFDLLVCDIGLPDMNGYDLLQCLRSLPNGNFPAIALTAFAGEGDREQALAVGFQQHLAKPIEPDVLIAAIANLVRLSQK
ncbi:PAS domain S-box protein [Leptodesmis sp.]|uniref:PAS domain S-box protein n=1 Tax=Leptodesmis sp. TaxID=3100501 RepID=UPI004053490B